MRQLRFVKPGGDRDHVVLETADGAEQFVLPINPALRDAIRADLPRLHTDEPEPPAGLNPREIQTRVRAGESPADLAVENEMSLERVMRFAGPVLAERSRIAGEARRGRARRSTTEGQVVIFGEAVDTRFTAHGIDPAKVDWDARRRDDGAWIVGARWIGGRAERQAEWLFQTGARSVSPLDDTAADLLSDRPIRAVIADLPARTPVSTAPPLAPGVVAFPAMPEAHTGPLPVVEDVFDQEASDPDAPRRPEPEAELPEHGTQPLPLPLPEPGAASDGEPGAGPRRSPAHRPLAPAGRRAESDAERNARARIPTWDDIMLGVRRKSD